MSNRVVQGEDDEVDVIFDGDNDLDYEEYEEYEEDYIEEDVEYILEGEHPEDNLTVIDALAGNDIPYDTISDEYDQSLIMDTNTSILLDDSSLGIASTPHDTLTTGDTVDLTQSVTIHKDDDMKSPETSSISASTVQSAEGESAGVAEGATTGGDVTLSKADHQLRVHQQRQLQQQQQQQYGIQTKYRNQFSSIHQSAHHILSQKISTVSHTRTRLHNTAVDCTRQLKHSIQSIDNTSNNIQSLSDTLDVLLSEHEWLSLFTLPYPPPLVTTTDGDDSGSN